MEKDKRMDNIDSISHKIVRNELLKTLRIKHVPAIITSIPENSNNTLATVLVQGKYLTLLNKTGELLSEDDGVIIHYWNTVANGYIALRSGLPQYLNNYSTGSDYYGELPVTEETNIKNAYILVESRNKSTTEYEYEVDETPVTTLSFALTDYNAITSVITTDENKTDYKSIGSVDIPEIYWSAASIPTYTDISYGFTVFNSLSCDIIQNDLIVPTSLSVIQDGTDVKTQLTVDGVTSYTLMDSGDAADYGLVIYLSNADVDNNTHHDVDYHRKTDSMYYNATIRFAHYYSNRWHFMVGDWGFRGISLSIVINSIPQSITHTEYTIMQNSDEI